MSAIDWNLSRRNLLASLTGIAALPAEVPAAAAGTIRPFQVNVPEATLQRIHLKLADARWPDHLESSDWRYGADVTYMKALVDHWMHRFDWRKIEAGLNRFPQFLARVEDFDIHFYHVKGNGPHALPIVLTHGWPYSALAFIDTIGPLTDPTRFGGSPADAFDVVIPSLPGYAFSSKPKGVPIGPPTTARLWNKLMTEVLGYSKYMAQGGDWGNAVTIQLGRQYPASLLGIHLNAAGSALTIEGDQSPEIREWQKSAGDFRTREWDYFNEQQHKPETVAFALNDNPLGLAAWMAEKFKGWTDSGPDLDSTVSKDQVLTSIMIYLVTDTVASSIWFYRGAADERPPVTGRVSVPTGFASFPKEVPNLNPPRSVLEKAFNLVHYTKMPRGGHFACLEQPQLFVDDLRLFRRKLLPQ